MIEFIIAVVFLLLGSYVTNLWWVQQVDDLNALHAAYRRAMQRELDAAREGRR